ncbi:hypothetical protein KKE34_04860 [Patescibacteria group bacterium]|nr:hypothetical protein [Patescibacteria group bacterium]MBU1885904.1 hypothetical protein [Patescibacteria group bacterium]
MKSKIVPYLVKAKPLYLVKAKPLFGTSYREVYKNAMVVYREIERRTKRKSYIRSAYFNKQKVFFDYFWQHLFQKNLKDRTRRLKFFIATIELIEKSENKPSQRIVNKIEIYRFYGRIKNSSKFVAQIKKDGRGLHLMSCFPWE